jgi:hypothetical protein
MFEALKKKLGIEKPAPKPVKPKADIELPPDILTTRHGRRAYKELLKRQAKVKILTLLKNGYTKAEIDAILRSR